MTSAVITPETKDTPLLTVAVNKLSSSSPFPSPGSPFFPPPIPSAHEYAPIPPLSKRRSTESRMMNVGSNTNHESAASSDPLVDVPSVPAPASPADKTSDSASTLDKRRERENTNITSNGINHGLVGPFAVQQPDSKPTVNGQVTTPTAKSPHHSAEAGGKPSTSSSEDTTLNIKPPTLSSLDNDDVSDDAGGTSAPSPSTPLSSSQNPAAAPPTTPHSFSSSFVVAAPATPTESARLSLDNNQNNSKSPSRNSLRSSRDSLASSRPAPPSPADSRRTSAVLSRHSSTRSRPGSIASLTPANNHDAEEASPTTPTPTLLQSQQQGQQQQQVVRRAPSSSAVAAPAPASTPMIPVKIRDFAFPDEDVRHAGTGPLTPRPNRRSQRPLSTWSASSASSAGSEEHDDPTSSAGGVGGASSYGFSGWGLGRLGWFGARSSTGAGTRSGTDNTIGGGPSQRDFARNFTEAMSPEYEADDPYESLDDDDDDDDNGQYGGVEEIGGERPLLPGLYRALYAFEPEGTAEMALEEDQIVRVIGRGGGVGWAIVARGDDEGHALVPEGYLELISLDRNSEQVGEEDV